MTIDNTSPINPSVSISSITSEMSHSNKEELAINALSQQLIGLMSDASINNNSSTCQVKEKQLDKKIKVSGSKSKSIFPEEILKIIFGMIKFEDNKAKENILQTCKQFNKIGPQVFDIRDTNGGYPIVETQLRRGEKGFIPLLKLLNHHQMTADCIQHIILPELVRQGSLAKIKGILENDRVPVLERYGRTFKLACQTGNLELVDFLLNHPKLNLQIEGTIETAFKKAAQQGHLKIIQLLLGCKKMDIHIVTASALEPFEKAFKIASQYGHTETVKLFLNDPFLKETINNLNLVVDTFSTMCKLGRLEVIKVLYHYLLKNDFQDDDVEDEEDIGGTYDYKKLLQYFMEEGGKDFQLTFLDQDETAFPPSIERLFESEDGQEKVLNLIQNPEMREYTQYVVRPWASFKGHKSIMSKLLEEGNNINLSMNQSEALEFACQQGHVEIVKMLLPYEAENLDQYKVFMLAIKQNQFEILKLLLETLKVDPSADDNEAIRLASKLGFVKIVKLLLAHPKVDPSAQHNEAILSAIAHGNLEIVNILLKDQRVDPSDQNNEAILLASAYGHLEIVKALLKDPRVNPADQNNEAIIAASYREQIEVVKTLLADERVDPSDQNNEALISAISTKWAIGKSNVEMVNILLKDPRVNPSDQNNEAFKIAIDNFSNSEYYSSEIIKILLANEKFKSTKENLDRLDRNDKEAQRALKQIINLYNDKHKHLNFMNKDYDSLRQIDKRGVHGNFIAKLQVISFAIQENLLEVIKTILADPRFRNIPFIEAINLARQKDRSKFEKLLSTDLRARKLITIHNNFKAFVQKNLLEILDFVLKNSKINSSMANDPMKWAAQGNGYEIKCFIFKKLNVDSHDTTCDVGPIFRNYFPQIMSTLNQNFNTLKGFLNNPTDSKLNTWIKKNIISNNYQGLLTFLLENQTAAKLVNYKEMIEFASKQKNTAVIDLLKEAESKFKCSKKT